MALEVSGLKERLVKCYTDWRPKSMPLRIIGSGIGWMFIYWEKLSSRLFRTF